MKEGNPKNEKDNKVIKGEDISEICGEERKKEDERKVNIF